MTATPLGLGPMIRIGQTDTIAQLPGKKAISVQKDGRLSDEFHQFLYAVGAALNNINPGSGYAPLASPPFTGVPTAPTAANGTDTTQIATTAFVANNALSLGAFAAPPVLGSTAPNAVNATTIVASSTITPATGPGIVGTIAADNANAGSVGEFESAVTTLTSVTSGTLLNATSLSIGAGDWDVYGMIQTNPAGTTTQSAVACGISTTSATYETFATGFTNATNLYTVPAGGNANLQAFPTRVNVSGTTTVYLVAQVNFAVSTLTIDGALIARRRR